MMDDWCLNSRFDRFDMSVDNYFLVVYNVFIYSDALLVTVTL
jgi:hypothetical protein